MIALRTPRRTAPVPGHHPRRGYLYVAVMMVSLIVGMTGLAAVHSARLQTRGSYGEGERQIARLLAESAVELATAEFNTNPAWETTYTLGVEYPVTPVAVTGGTLTWKLVDLGGGAKRLDGIGRKGDAECTISVDLGTSGGYLDDALVSSGQVWLQNHQNAITLSGGKLVSNTSIDNSGTINGDVEAPTLTGTGTYNGTTTTPGTTRLLPRAEDIVSYYSTEGTLLPNASLGNTPALVLENVLLSPSSNPFGTPNAHGIYVIDGEGGSNLTIRNCRIVGTLLVKNLVWGTITVEEAVNWEPAYANYPALLADADLDLKFHDQQLSETAVGVNFNPPLTPYQGSTNATATDTYPSRMAGIVWCSSDLLFDGDNNDLAPTISGVVIVGGTTKVKFRGKPSLTYDPSFAATPAPCFGGGDSAAIVTGSWRQTTN